MKFDTFLNSVSKIENIELPAQDSQFKMAPPFRKELIQRHEKEIIKAKQAAVLALFYPNSYSETYLVLILRKTYKGVHSAQVGFPGGKVESMDISLKHTALRETYEEIGVHTNDITVLKQLTEVYIPPSNYFVQPFLAFSNITPNFIKQDEEVEDIIEVPAKQFIDDDSVINCIVDTSYSKQVKVPAFKLAGHVVWGATAMMLSEIKDLLKPHL